MIMIKSKQFYKTIILYYFRILKNFLTTDNDNENKKNLYHVYDKKYVDNCFTY